MSLCVFVLGVGATSEEFWLCLIDILGFCEGFEGMCPCTGYASGAGSCTNLTSILYPCVLLQVRGKWTDSSKMTIFLSKFVACLKDSTLHDKINNTTSGSVIKLPEGIIWLGDKPNFSNDLFMRPCHVQRPKTSTLSWTENLTQLCVQGHWGLENCISVCTW